MAKRSQESAAVSSFESLYFNSNHGTAAGAVDVGIVNYEKSGSREQDSRADFAQRDHERDGEEADGDENDPSYRKVPIKDLINSFENQSRPVMRYKLADEQIIKKVYSRQAAAVEEEKLAKEQNNHNNNENNCTEKNQSDREQLDQYRFTATGETIHEEEEEKHEEQISTTTSPKLVQETSPGTTKESNYDSDACQGILGELPK